MSSSSPSLTFLRSGLRIIAGKIPRIAERLLGGLLIIRASTYRASPLIGHSNPLTPGENGCEQRRLCTHNMPSLTRLTSGVALTGCPKHCMLDIWSTANPPATRCRYTIRAYYKQAHTDHASLRSSLFSPYHIYSRPPYHTVRCLQTALLPRLHAQLQTSPDPSLHASPHASLHASLLLMLMLMLVLMLRACSSMLKDILQTAPINDFA